MSANYYCLLFNINGTLFDIEEAEKTALSLLLEQNNIPFGANEIALFIQIGNELNQAQAERKSKKITATTRFSEFLQKIENKSDAAQLSLKFSQLVKENLFPYSGAAELLEELGEFATIAATTSSNHRWAVDLLEKTKLAPYFDAVFSTDRVRAEKTEPKFYQHILKNLGIQNRQKVLVISDDICNDIHGASAAKLDSCLCNFTSLKLPKKPLPTHTATSFSQLKLIAVGEEELNLASTREKRHMV